jgi:hypothetical protein
MKTIERVRPFGIIIWTILFSTLFYTSLITSSGICLLLALFVLLTCPIFCLTTDVIEEKGNENV